MLSASVCPIVKESIFRELVHPDILEKCLVPVTKCSLMHLRRSLASPRLLFNGNKLRLAPRVVDLASVLLLRTHRRRILRLSRRVQKQTNGILTRPRILILLFVIFVLPLTGLIGGGMIRFQRCPNMIFL